MGRDIGEWTAQILNDGLPPLPERLDRGEIAPIVAWRGTSYGAVLFIRIWKNGNVDTECAIAERAADGSWGEPGGWGGSGWIDDPLVRSDIGMGRRSRRLDGCQRAG